MKETISKYGPFLLLGLVAFAAGRFSVKEKRLSQTERQTIIEQYEKQIATINESHLREIEEVKSKYTVTEKVIVIDKDGNTKITETTKSKEESKKNDKSETKVETKIETVVVEKIVEKTKEVIKVIPPPTFRVYGAAAMNDPNDKRIMSYGPGVSYDMGPFSVGGFGLYAPNNSNYNAVGFTAGIVF